MPPLRDVLDDEELIAGTDVAEKPLLCGERFRTTSLAVAEPTPAFDVFAPSPDDVAQRSGVSLRSVYRYFADAEDLLRAAIDRHGQRPAQPGLDLAHRLADSQIAGREQCQHPVAGFLINRHFAKSADVVDAGVGAAV